MTGVTARTGSTRMLDAVTSAVASGLEIPDASVTREDLERFQLARANAMIAYARENSPFYRETLADVEPLASLQDLSRLPFVTADDLRSDPYRLLCVSLTGVARVFAHFTTGTTSRPKKVFFSEADTERIVRTMAAVSGSVLENAGLDPAEATVAIYLPNNGRPLSMAEMIAEGVRRLGGTPVIGSCEDETEEQIGHIMSLEPDMLMGSAFRIWRITQVGRESRDLKSAGVKAVFITSEYLSSTMRARIEMAWGATVFHHYGMTEPGFVIGIECAEHAGFHYNESDLYFEVIDPVTREPVGDGEEGELVFTSLAREAMPLIRYRTGDIASITSKPCACGADLLSRIGTMPKKIGMIHTLATGELLYSALLDEALYGVKDLIDYRIWLTREDGQDQLLCKAEMLGSDEAGFARRVRESLLVAGPVGRAVASGALSAPAIEIAPRESLRRGGRSLKRKIVDERP